MEGICKGIVPFVGVTLMARRSFLKSDTLYTFF